MKRPITLLEVIIALSLTAILLSVLMGSAARLFATRSKLEGAKQEVLGNALLQARLASLFSHLAEYTPSEEGLSKKEPQGPLESLDGKRLKMWLADYIDPEPAFSGTLTALLYEKKRSLILELIGKNGETRKEVLMSDIRSFSLQFFDPFETPPRLIDTWKGKTGDFPSHLLLTLQGGKHSQERELAFFFPSLDTFVIYHSSMNKENEVHP